MHAILFDACSKPELTRHSYCRHLKQSTPQLLRTLTQEALQYTAAT